MGQPKSVSSYRAFVGREIDTKSGKAVILSASGRYGVLGYKECDGVGWVDLSKLAEEKGENNE